MSLLYHVVQAAVRSLESGDSILILSSAWRQELSRSGSADNKHMVVARGYSNIRVIGMTL